MLYGMLISAFSDTKNRPGFKWFLIFLILLGAAAGGGKEYLDDKASKKDQKKMDEAVALAKSSNKLAKDEIKNHETDVQEFAKERDRLESELNQTRNGAFMLVGQVSEMMEEIDNIEKAATKVRKPELAEMGLKARVEASKNVVSIANDAQWLDPPEISKLEAWFKEDQPLKPKHFNAIQTGLKNRTTRAEEQ